MKQPKPSPASRHRQANRHVAVFVSLIATVTLTVLLLVVLKTPPLTDVTWRTLLVADGADAALDVSPFQTAVPAAPGRWRYIYVHHSRTRGGDADATAYTAADGTTPAHGSDDHFVIGNGDGTGDGDVQATQLWNRQQPIDHPPAGAKLSASTVSICLVGDYARGRPSPAQQRALAELVTALQQRLHIPAAAVFAHPEVDTAAGVGHAFPAAAFHAALVP